MVELVITMPQLGESVGEGTIERWVVQPGESVAELDTLVSISTEKVAAEVPAPATGVLREILAPEGSVVPVGAAIAVLELPANPDEGANRDAQSPALQGFAGASSSTSDPGTGPSPAPTSTPTPAVVAPPAVDDEVVPLTALRRRIAERMTISKSTIPHALQVQEVDMAGVMASIAAHREQPNQPIDASLTPLHYVLAAAAAALKYCPELNATFADDGIVLHRRIDIGVAVALPDGVVVPVLRGAEGLSVRRLAGEVARLVAAARSRSLSIDQMSGSTFTVNNSGSLGTLFSYSVIQPGESAVLTLGAVTERPWVLAGSVVPRPLMYLSLSIDHRVVDGRDAATFLGACRHWLEEVTVETPLD